MIFAAWTPEDMQGDFGDPTPGENGVKRSALVPSPAGAAAATDRFASAAARTRKEKVSTSGDRSGSPSSPQGTRNLVISPGTCTHARTNAPWASRGGHRVNRPPGRIHVGQAESDPVFVSAYPSRLLFPSKRFAAPFPLAVWTAYPARSRSRIVLT
jgi:hypothetical protein